MLAFFLRGCFFIGVISWYSQSVWNLIDGYFREQFTKYLREELAKNPKMRADLKAPSGHIDKAEDLVTKETSSMYMKDAGVDTADSFLQTISAGMSYDESELKTETEISTSDKSITRPVNVLNYDNKKLSDSMTDIIEATTKNSELYNTISNGEITQRQNIIKKKRKHDRINRYDILKAKKKKNKVKLLKLTEADFKSARRSIDYDFSKFEVDEDDDDIEANLETEGGILVSELPYNPRLDIGGLQRISEDEFCPLSPEDEANCDDIKVWP